MSVPAVNLRLEKGTDFEATFTVTQSDGSVLALNNTIASAKIRRHPTATTSKSFTTSITVAKGEIKITMSAANTATLTSGRNYYDLIITDNITGKVTKVFEGMIMVVDTLAV